MAIEPSASPHSSIYTPHSFHTESDSHDLFREYCGSFPSYDPENLASLDHLCDSLTFQCRPATPSSSPSSFAPFLNATTWQLISWFYNSSPQKSLQDLDNLVHNVILADDFDREDLHEFGVRCETKWLDDAPRDPSSPLFSSDGWHTVSIPIRLPCKKVKQPEDQAPVFLMEGLHYWPITEVVKSAFKEPVAEMFHTMPYKLYWQPDKTCPPEHVITKLYTADTMLEEHEKIKSNHLKVSGCNLETVIATIMIWSDSTHLASFGNAAL
ncbi:hypothetical protein SCLCIDRAFT_133111 [Scleroderma citrinum Foug A]|uniref:Uncharacterized protein n=1 Tax=Scleroderma citrinum Foug A TaxID=1036808 RepID=A0A0C2Z2X0_9AGAM|nr:hypothetical protein SCLCIDRAFT_133111 [Scleroderma citrinum Foug A]